jgi:hypothetical protein
LPSEGILIPENLVLFSGGLRHRPVTDFVWFLQMAFYMRFREAHPDVVVGKRVFDSLQPYWVKKLEDINVCCCIYHVEMEELLSAFN